MHLEAPLEYFFYELKIFGASQEDQYDIASSFLHLLELASRPFKRYTNNLRFKSGHHHKSKPVTVFSAPVPVDLPSRKSETVNESNSKTWVNKSSNPNDSKTETTKLSKQWQNGRVLNSNYDEEFPALGKEEPRESKEIKEPKKSVVQSSSTSKISSVEYLLDSNSPHNWASDDDSDEMPAFEEKSIESSDKNTMAQDTSNTHTRQEVRQDVQILRRDNLGKEQVRRSISSSYVDERRNQTYDNRREMNFNRRDYYNQREPSDFKKRYDNRRDSYEQRKESFPPSREYVERRSIPVKAHVTTTESFEDIEKKRKEEIKRIATEKRLQKEQEEKRKEEEKQERIRKLLNDLDKRKQQQLEQERLEKERLEKERLEQERLKKEEEERIEKERQEKLEKERLEKEKQERLELEKNKQDKERPPKGKPRHTNPHRPHQTSNKYKSGQYTHRPSHHSKFDQKNKEFESWRKPRDSETPITDTKKYGGQKKHDEHKKRPFNKDDEFKKGSFNKDNEFKKRPYNKSVNESKNTRDNLPINEQQKVQEHRKFKHNKYIEGHKKPSTSSNVQEDVVHAKKEIEHTPSTHQDDKKSQVPGNRKYSRDESGEHTKPAPGDHSNQNEKVHSKKLATKKTHFVKKHVTKKSPPQKPSNPVKPNAEKHVDNVTSSTKIDAPSDATKHVQEPKEAKKEENLNREKKFDEHNPNHNNRFRTNYHRGSNYRKPNQVRYVKKEA